MSTAMSDAKTLLDCVLYWEKTAPERVCFTQPQGGGDANVRTITYRQFLDEARRMAAYLRSLNLPEHSQIAICSKNTAHWVIADVAIWMAGHVTVPIYPILTADIVRYTLEHSESKLLFVGKLDAVWDEMKKGVPSDLPKIALPLAPANDYPKWDDIIAKHEPLREIAARRPDEMATIIYTSGSTGRPKGAMISFGTMLTACIGIARVLKTSPDDRILSYLPMAHTFERWVVEAHALYAGIPLWFAESLDTFLADLRRARPTLFISVPRLWLKFQLGVFHKLPPKKLDRMLKIPILSGIVKKKILRQLGLDCVRFAGSGSAPIPKEVIEWYHKIGLELLEGYGMTENFAYSHLTRPGEVRPGYVGSTHPEVQCRIGEGGEVQVKSPGNMMGYFKQPEATAEMLTSDGFIKTGDRGEVDELGRLKLTGRLKEIFKTSRGKYVAPAPIENIVTNHPRVEACCVCGAGQSRPYAVLMLSQEARSLVAKNGEQRATLEQELSAHLQAVNNTLPQYEQLQFLAVVKDEWLPENGFLTPTMKVKRSKIEETYAPQAEKWMAGKANVVWE